MLLQKFPIHREHPVSISLQSVKKTADIFIMFIKEKLVYIKFIIMGSEKEKILDCLIVDAIQNIICNDEIESDEEEEILEELSENIEIVMMNRRGIVYNIPKSFNWCNNILTMLDEDRFKQMIRVERNQFMQLVELIKNAEVFNNAHSNKQLTVEMQLAVVLFRLGSSGESASLRKIASIFGIGDGGTISKITNRVFSAILKLTSNLIYWPDEIERSQIVADSFHELPYCIGYIDGTEIELAEAPILDPVKYFSRSHVYAIKVQAVCDYKLKIRHLVVGRPGSWHDSRIYKTSTIFQKPEYFSWQQWIAGDSAYPLSERLITPYRSNSKHLDRNSRIKFNLRHSSYRVRVEHCFGHLKEKFCSLKQLRMRLANKENFKFCCEWITVCCTLHNFLKSTGETSCTPDIEQGNFEDISDEEENTTSSSAENKRQAIYSLMFNNT